MWLVERHGAWVARLDGLSWRVWVERGDARSAGSWTGRGFSGLEPPVLPPDALRVGLARRLDAAEDAIRGELARREQDARARVRAPMGARAEVAVVRLRGRPELVVSLAGPLGDANAPQPLRTIADQWFADVCASLAELGWSRVASGSGREEERGVRFVVLHHEGADARDKVVG